MAAWGVEQYKWRDGTTGRFELFKPPVLERICSMLESLDGFVFAGTATLDESLFRTGEIDSTSDIPSMSRSDLIWSMSATFVLGTLIMELLKHGSEVGTVDIHFDPKSLKAAHSGAWQKALQQLVVREAKRFASQIGFRHFEKLRIRRVEPVTKPEVGEKPDKFQMGTWIADKLCSHLDKVELAKKSSRIFTLDMSEEVRRTTQQFDGKSFYES